MLKLIVSLALVAATSPAAFAGKGQEPTDLAAYAETLNRIFTRQGEGDAPVPVTVGGDRARLTWLGFVQRDDGTYLCPVDRFNPAYDEFGDPVYDEAGELTGSTARLDVELTRGAGGLPILLIRAEHSATSYVLTARGASSVVFRTETSRPYRASTELHRPWRIAVASIEASLDPSGRTRYDIVEEIYAASDALVAANTVYGDDGQAVLNAEGDPEQRALATGDLPALAAQGLVQKLRTDTLSWTQLAP